MDTDIHRCNGCGCSFERRNLSYHTTRKSGIHKHFYLCHVCSEVKKKKEAIRITTKKYLKPRMVSFWS